MDSSENKGRENVAYLNCFFRSLMFKRVATLPGIDSGLLFLKALCVKSLVYFAIFLNMLYISKWLNIWTLCLLVLLIFIASLEYILFIMLFAFIFNLFLADKFIRVVNIFLFSGSHVTVVSAILLFSATYKVKVYSGETIVQPNTAKTNICNLTNEETRILHETNFNITIENERSKEFSFILIMVSFIAFFVLLIKNIRALRRK